MTIKISVDEQQESKTAHSAPKISVDEQQEIKAAHSALKTSVDEQQEIKTAHSALKTSVNEQQEIKTAHSAPKISVDEQQEIKTAHSAPKIFVDEQQGLNRFLINTRPPAPNSNRPGLPVVLMIPPLCISKGRVQQKSKHPCKYMNACFLNNVNTLKLMTLPYMERPFD